MNPDPLLRPELSLTMILGYALFAFALGLVLTPWFISFLRRNKLGKQLRVETVDGREASIFRQYHQKKFGTPTMGGLLIWGSILLTVLFSRFLALTGAVPNSLLQRGEVYLPLFTLLAFAILGALDDYLNIVGTDEARMRQSMPHIKRLLAAIVAGGCISIYFYFLYQTGDMGAAFDRILTNFGPIGYGLLILLFLASLFLLTIRHAAVDEWIVRFMIRQGAKRGLGALPKMTLLILFSLAAALWFYYALERDEIYIPFYSATYGPLELGAWYIPLFVFIIVATANAVNVTDGLDGLAGGLLVIAFGTFGALAYLYGLNVLAGFCAVTAGAIAAFLWHNVPPALFYMGDTGSLALGGTLGVIAMMTDQLFVLPLAGFVFVIELLSVVIQLTSKRLRGGKKVFKAAPIHHHFEALEWGESKVTMRLWIIGAFAAFLGLIVGIVG